MFELTLDLSRVNEYLIKHKVREYTGVYPTICLTAYDPDEACFLAINNLKELLLFQNSNAKFIDNFILPYIKISKIRIKDV